MRGLETSEADIYDQFLEQPELPLLPDGSPIGVQPKLRRIRNPYGPNFLRRKCSTTKDSLLAKVKDRCLVGGNSGCWLWLAEVDSKQSSRGPIIYVSCECQAPKVYNVRRLVYFGIHAYQAWAIMKASCGTTDCVNPEHIKLAGTECEGKRFKKEEGDMIPCMGCSLKFETWNRKFNRHCERCKNFLNNDVNPTTTAIAQAQEAAKIEVVAEAIDDGLEDQFELMAPPRGVERRKLQEKEEPNV